jgi:hypothetical protein
MKITSHLQHVLAPTLPLAATLFLAACGGHTNTRIPRRCRLDLFCRQVAESRQRRHHV